MFFFNCIAVFKGMLEMFKYFMVVNPNHMYFPPTNKGNGTFLANSSQTLGLLPIGGQFESSGIFLAVISKPTWD